MMGNPEARAWVEQGTALVLDAVGSLDESSMAAPSRLPDWTRKHLVAHLAANADALGNLVAWARTGQPTPMYSSPEQRADDIESGAGLDAETLTVWLNKSAQELAAATASVTEEQWQTEVVTAQGRTVGASEIFWMRAREVCVHAVDLGAGLEFRDLPEAFLATLVKEIAAKRGMASLPAGPGPEVAAYLAGRKHSLVNVPDLGPWL